MSSPDDLGREVTSVLGYLLKHATLQLIAATTEALEPFGIDSRDLGVLRVVASRQSTSQQEVSQLLGVDRTTMVALLDGLEAKKIVSRHPLVHDRRRNVVELTDEGQHLFHEASRVEHEAEDAYLSTLNDHEAQSLREFLHRVVTEQHPGSSDD
ncbi:MarR family winged helix-turn-helix transcriptional regulator [Paramicrobacterium chengjingii]|uniref:Winged helix DNA-binding protein n=1 Tax=Paramicrobacterium chengjingii TaxID=2769067 RepID=A0ABX6YJC2_9MICO|nr:MarR family transcriptional regulator [Microbacterium chengjingii]QPZ38893.1 winged helix DNA-binding protein [Microbacterium chengjingii]